MLGSLTLVAVCWALSTREHTQLSLLDAENLMWDIWPCGAAVHYKPAGPLEWQITGVHGIGS